MCDLCDLGISKPQLLSYLIEVRLSVSVNSFIIYILC